MRRSLSIFEKKYRNSGGERGRCDCVNGYPARVMDPPPFRPLSGWWRDTTVECITPLHWLHNQTKLLVHFVWQCDKMFYIVALCRYFKYLFRFRWVLEMCVELRFVVWPSGLIVLFKIFGLGRSSAAWLHSTVCCAGLPAAVRPILPDFSLQTTCSLRVCQIKQTKASSAVDKR